MERIFASGMREFMKLRERRVADAGALLDGARRAMRASFQRELDAIESNLSFLASVGSVSPYVGLFGTVWGIMHAFVGLSNLQQVTLATVAPGIAEALVATAIGLFAAIPAVIAYNRFARDIDRIAIQLETFIEEFSNILQRNAGHACRGAALSADGRPGRCMPAVTAAQLAPPHHQRDQHGAVHRRDAGAADHLHGQRAADHHRRGRPAEVGKAQPAAATHVIEVVVGSDESLRLRVDGKDAAAASRSPTSPRACASAQGGDADDAGRHLGRPNVKYEAVVKVMDALQRAGVQRVGLSVKSQRA